MPVIPMHKAAGENRRLCHACDGQCGGLSGSAGRYGIGPWQCAQLPPTGTWAGFGFFGRLAPALVAAFALFGQALFEVWHCQVFRRQHGVAGLGDGGECGGEEEEGVA